MFKRTIAIVLIVFILLTPAFAAKNDTKTPLKVIFDGEEVTFTTPALIVNGVPMLPMREFFEVLGASVSWFGQTQQVTAHRNNMYVKLKIGEKVAYRNGKSYTLTHAPLIIDSRTYLPARFIAESFDITYTYQNGTSTLTSRNTSRSYVFNDMFYVTKSIDDYNITLAFPFGWRELEPNVYGQQDIYDDYRMAVKRYENQEGYAIKDYKNAYKEELIRTFGSKITFNYDSKVITDDHVFESFGYFYNTTKQKRFYEVFILEIDKEFYIFEGSYDAKTDVAFIKEIYQTTLKTVQHSAKSLESINEHYVEWPLFIELETKLDQEFTSNLDASSSLKFSGSLGQVDNITKLYATVLKDTKSTTYNIPVNDEGKFDTKIYLPFGLGKHNIRIYASTKEAVGNNLLLQFSVINLSNKDTLYLIPSRYVESDTIEATSLTSYLTHGLTTSNLKARAIYTYLTQEISLEVETQQHLENMRTSNKVITDGAASPLELNLLSAALLRAASIPAKVNVGTFKRVNHYFTEAQINGTWVIIDPVSAIHVDQNPLLSEIIDVNDANIYNQYDTYFHLSTSKYKSLLKDVKVLNY